MKRLDAHIRAFQRSLEQRPEILDSIRMYIAVYVFFRVVDHLMNVVLFKAVVSDPRIAEYIRSTPHILAHKGLQGACLCVRNVPQTNLAGMTIQQTHHDGFARSASSGDFRFFVLVHVARETADKGFVRFNLATAERVGTALLHREPDSMVHEPCGLLRDSETARNFVTADSVLAIGDQPHCSEPLIETDWRVLEDGSDLERELCALVFRVAFPQPRSLKIRDMIRVAGWATDLTVWPAHRDHEVFAVVPVREVLNRLLECARIFRHAN